MVPERTRRPSSWPIRLAMNSCSELVVTSSSISQSPSDVLTMLSSMGSVGLVKMSERKSLDDSSLWDHARLDIASASC